MHQFFRIVTAAGAASLVAAGLLATPAIAATGSSPASRPPLSAKQMLADRQLHAKAAQAAG